MTEEEELREIVLEDIRISTEIDEDEIFQTKYNPVTKGYIDELSREIWVYNKLYDYILENQDMDVTDCIAEFSQTMFDNAYRNEKAKRMFYDAFYTLSNFLEYVYVMMEELEGEENET